jgi:hypothetical protein
MLGGMPRRSFYTCVLLALLVAVSSVGLAGQESLGDIARRIREGKGEDASSPAGKTPANPVAKTAKPQPAANAADVNATMNLLSERDDVAYATRVRTQLQQENFRVLDDVAAAERTGKTRFAGGGWKLHTFYAAVESPKGKAPATEADWADTLDRLKRWLAQQPDSITARVALAYSYLNYGWQARGDGDVSSVTPESKRLFDERVKLAEDELSQVPEAPCPEWYYVMLQVGRAKGWEADDLTALLQRAMALEPEFYYSYQEVALSLMPKWRGKEGDVEKFAEEQANRIGGKPGDILYWQITQSIMSNRELGDIPQHLSWSRALVGYQDLVGQYGASRLRQNQFAQVAAGFGDYMVADETITQIGDRWDQETWGTKEYFEKVKTWARSSADPFRKIIEAYKAVNANIATPEGRRYDSVIATEFSTRYSRAVKDCSAGANGPSPTLVILQVGKSGAVQQMMVVPENARDACLRPKLENATFSPPPKPEYWVRVALSANP